MKLNATAAIDNSDTYAQKLQEANTQVELCLLYTSLALYKTSISGYSKVVD